MRGSQLVGGGGVHKCHTLARFCWSVEKTHSWKQRACVQCYAFVIRHGKAVPSRSKMPFGKTYPGACQEIQALTASVLSEMAAGTHPRRSREGLPSGWGATASPTLAHLEGLISPPHQMPAAKGNRLTMKHQVEFQHPVSEFNREISVLALILQS